MYSRTNSTTKKRQDNTAQYNDYISGRKVPISSILHPTSKMFTSKLDIVRHQLEISRQFKEKFPEDRRISAIGATAPTDPKPDTSMRKIKSRSKTKMSQRMHQNTNRKLNYNQSQPILRSSNKSNQKPINIAHRDEEDTPQHLRTPTNPQYQRHSPPRYVQQQLQSYSQSQSQLSYKNQYIMTQNQLTHALQSNIQLEKKYHKLKQNLIYFLEEPSSATSLELKKYYDTDRDWKIIQKYQTLLEDLDSHKIVLEEILKLSELNDIGSLLEMLKDKRNNIKNLGEYSCRILELETRCNQLENQKQQQILKLNQAHKQTLKALKQQVESQIHEKLREHYQGQLQKQLQSQVSKNVDNIQKIVEQVKISERLEINRILSGVLEGVKRIAQGVGVRVAGRIKGSKPQLKHITQEKKTMLKKKENGFGDSTNFIAHFNDTKDKLYSAKSAQLQKNSQGNQYLKQQKDNNFDNVRDKNFVQPLSFGKRMKRAFSSNVQNAEHQNQNNNMDNSDQNQADIKMICNNTGSSNMSGGNINMFQSFGRTPPIKHLPPQYKLKNSSQTQGQNQSQAQSSHKNTYFPKTLYQQKQIELSDLDINMKQKQLSQPQQNMRPCTQSYKNSYAGPSNPHTEKKSSKKFDQKLRWSLSKDKQIPYPNHERIPRIPTSPKNSSNYNFPYDLNVNNSINQMAAYNRQAAYSNLEEKQYDQNEQEQRSHQLQQQEQQINQNADYLNHVNETKINQLTNQQDIQLYWNKLSQQASINTYNNTKKDQKAQKSQNPTQLLLQSHINTQSLLSQLVGVLSSIRNHSKNHYKMLSQTRKIEQTIQIYNQQIQQFGMKLQSLQIQNQTQKHNFIVHYEEIIEEKQRQYDYKLDKLKEELKETVNERDELEKQTERLKVQIQSFIERSKKLQQDNYDIKDKILRKEDLINKIVRDVWQMCGGGSDISILFNDPTPRSSRQSPQFQTQRQQTIESLPPNFNSLPQQTLSLTVEHLLQSHTTYLKDQLQSATSLVQMQQSAIQIKENLLKEFDFNLKKLKEDGQRYKQLADKMVLQRDQYKYLLNVSRDNIIEIKQEHQQQLLALSNQKDSQYLTIHQDILTQNNRLSSQLQLLMSKQQQYTFTKKKNQQLEQTLQQLRKKYYDMEKDNSLFKEERKQIKGELGRIEEDTKRLQAEVQRLERENKITSDELREQKSKCGRLVDDVNIREQKYNILMFKFEQLKKEHIKQVNQNQFLSDQNSNLRLQNLQILSLQQQQHSLQTKNYELAKDKQRLTQQINKITKQLLFYSRERNVKRETKLQIKNRIGQQINKELHCIREEWQRMRVFVASWLQQFSAQMEGEFCQILKELEACFGYIGIKKKQMLEHLKAKQKNMNNLSQQNQKLREQLTEYKQKCQNNKLNDLEASNKLRYVLQDLQDIRIEHQSLRRQFKKNPIFTDQIANFRKLFTSHLKQTQNKIRENIKDMFQQNINNKDKEFDQMQDYYENKIKQFQTTIAQLRDQIQTIQNQFENQMKKARQINQQINSFNEKKNGIKSNAQQAKNGQLSPCQQNPLNPGSHRSVYTPSLKQYEKLEQQNKLYKEQTQILQARLKQYEDKLYHYRQKQKSSEYDESKSQISHNRSMSSGLGTQKALEPRNSNQQCNKCQKLRKMCTDSLQILWGEIDSLRVDIDRGRRQIGDILENQKDFMNQLQQQSSGYIQTLIAQLEEKQNEKQSLKYKPVTIQFQKAPKSQEQLQQISLSQFEQVNNQKSMCSSHKSKSFGNKINKVTQLQPRQSQESQLLLEATPSADYKEEKSRDSQPMQELSNYQQEENEDQHVPNKYQSQRPSQDQAPRQQKQGHQTQRKYQHTNMQDKIGRREQIGLKYISSKQLQSDKSSPHFGHPNELEITPRKLNPGLQAMEVDENQQQQNYSPQFKKIKSKNQSSSQDVEVKQTQSQKNSYQNNKNKSREIDFKDNNVDESKGIGKSQQASNRIDLIKPKRPSKPMLVTLGDHYLHSQGDVEVSSPQPQTERLSSSSHNNFKNRKNNKSKQIKISTSRDGGSRDNQIEDFRSKNFSFYKPNNNQKYDDDFANQDNSKQKQQEQQIYLQNQIKNKKPSAINQNLVCLKNSNCSKRSQNSSFLHQQYDQQIYRVRRLFSSLQSAAEGNEEPKVPYFQIIKKEFTEIKRKLQGGLTNIGNVGENDLSFIASNKNCLQSPSSFASKLFNFQRRICSQPNEQNQDLQIDNLPKQTNRSQYENLLSSKIKNLQKQNQQLKSGQKDLQDKLLEAQNQYQIQLNRLRNNYEQEKNQKQKIEKQLNYFKNTESQTNKQRCIMRFLESLFNLNWDTAESNLRIFLKLKLKNQPNQVFIQRQIQDKVGKFKQFADNIKALQDKIKGDKSKSGIFGFINKLSPKKEVKSQGREKDK